MSLWCSLSLFPSLAISFYHPLCVALIDVEGFAKIFNNMPSQTFILASKDLAQNPFIFTVVVAVVAVETNTVAINLV